jgi:predicted small secreted protein
MKRMICLLMLSAFFAGTLAACNTVKGAGQDVQKVGGKMEESAEKTGGTGTK